MRFFRRPQERFSGIDAEVLARLAALAADLVLVSDAEGCVVDLSLSSDAWVDDAVERWIGLQLAEVVAPDSRAKLDEMVRDAEVVAEPAPAGARWRQLNLRLPGGEVQLADTVVMRLAPGTGLVLMARSLRRDEQVQQRLVQAQQAMERDYWQFRQAETRYRQLFQASSEGVLLLAADSLQIEEANPAACRLLDGSERSLIGQPLPALFDGEADRVLALLAGVRASGRPAELRLALGRQRVDVEVAASAYRQGGVAHVLVRLVRQGDAAAAGPADQSWAALARTTPDGLLLTDPEGRVLAANPAFLELAQLGAESQAVGRSLDRWLGRSGVDLNVLLSNLRQRGMVRLFATQLRGEFGAMTDLIEQLCIEAALELTRGNRAAAAEMLGLSRQSLYVKLRRYGLKDLGIEDEK
jgi:transcriptional regulator PpsR